MGRKGFPSALTLEAAGFQRISMRCPTSSKTIAEEDDGGTVGEGPSLPGHVNQCYFISFAFWVSKVKIHLLKVSMG